jgi:hypothetical protein
MAEKRGSYAPLLYQKALKFRGAFLRLSLDSQDKAVEWCAILNRQAREWNCRLIVLSRSSARSRFSRGCLFWG